MLTLSQKKEEILLTVLDYLERNGYKESYEKLKQKTGVDYIEQNTKKIEDLFKLGKIKELIAFIKNNNHIPNEEKLYYLKLLKIKYFIKLVVNNCINKTEQKDSLNYLRTEITPLLNKDNKGSELLNSLTYILFIKDELVLNAYIQNFLLSYSDNNFILSQISKNTIIPLEKIYDNYIKCVNNVSLNLENYSKLNIIDNCLSPCKSGEIWFLEISKNKNYICAGFSNANISIFNIKKINDKINIKLEITFSANEENKRDEITALCFTIDEKYILVGLSNFKLIIFDINTGQKIKEYNNLYKDRVTSIIPFPNSINKNKFITGSIDKKILILDISNIYNNKNGNNLSGNNEYTEIGKFCRIKQLCYSELLNYIVILSASNTDIIIYNLNAKKIEFKITTSEQSKNIYEDISKSDKGKYIIYSTSIPNKASKIILYNLTTKLVEEKFIGFCQKYMIIKCCFCGFKDKFILSGSEDYIIYVWERGYSTFPKYKFEGHFGVVNTVEMWENDFIISGSDDKSIKIWYGKNEKLKDIKYEKNKENKYIKKEKNIDKEFYDAMNASMELELNEDEQDNRIFNFDERIYDFDEGEEIVRFDEDNENENDEEDENSII